MPCIRPHCSHTPTWIAALLLSSAYVVALGRVCATGRAAAVADRMRTRAGRAQSKGDEYHVVSLTNTPRALLHGPRIHPHSTLMPVGLPLRVFIAPIRSFWCLYLQRIPSASLCCSSPRPVPRAQRAPSCNLQTMITACGAPLPQPCCDARTRVGASMSTPRWALSPRHGRTDVLFTTLVRSVHHMSPEVDLCCSSRVAMRHALRWRWFPSGGWSSGQSTTASFLPDSATRRYVDSLLEICKYLSSAFHARYPGARYCRSDHSRRGLRPAASGPRLPRPAGAGRLPVTLDAGGRYRPRALTGPAHCSFIPQ